MVKKPAFWLLALCAALLHATANASGLPPANPALAEQVEALPEADLIIYTPAEVKHRVTVFTDVNCPFCRRLHTQMDDYLLFDIEIRYAAFPNINNALEQMHGVWCSEDRKAAMTKAKRNEIVKVEGCRSEAVDEQLEIALVHRFLGTPAIVTPRGRVLYGHVTADRLIEVLELEAATP